MRQGGHGPALELALLARAWDFGLQEVSIPVRIWQGLSDVLLVREAVPGHGSQVRGWMNCAALASYLLGRKYWVWTPHGLYKLLLREPDVCPVDVSVLLESDLASLAAPGTRVITACPKCRPGTPRPPGAPKPFCMSCGRDLTPGWGDKVRAQAGQV